MVKVMYKDKLVYKIVIWVLFGLMMKVFSMTCFKKPSFAKRAISSLKIFLWLTQPPNTSIQISRNNGATKKASRKMVHDKVVFFCFFLKHFGKKTIFLPKNGGTTKTSYKP